jgi:hypothetical protein
MSMKTEAFGRMVRGLMLKEKEHPDESQHNRALYVILADELSYPEQDDGERTKFLG